MEVEGKLLIRVRTTWSRKGVGGGGGLLGGGVLVGGFVGGGVFWGGVVGVVFGVGGGGWVGGGVFRSPEGYSLACKIPRRTASPLGESFRTAFRENPAASADTRGTLASSEGKSRAGTNLPIKKRSTSGEAATVIRKREDQARRGF